MNVYIWRNVLRSYHEGMIIAYAENALSAWEMLRKDTPSIWAELQGREFNDREGETSLTAGRQPEELTAEEVFVIYGND